MSEYILEMQGITKDFFGVKAIDDLDLRVRPGECVGLCGENGAGKSTLMKVLSGVYPHGTWSGSILWEGRELKARTVRDTEKAGIVIIHQELTIVPQLSVAENIFLGQEPLIAGAFVDYASMNEQAETLMRELKAEDVNVAFPAQNYGGGKQQMVEIAKALSKKAKLIIFDEPSSSLSLTETRALLDLVKRLKARGVACVYISHKLNEVAEIADTVAVIRDGRRIGSAPMKEIDIPRIIAMMVGREIKTLFPREPHEIGEVVFEARHVVCWDVNNPLRKVVDDVSFAVRKGEILGVAGLVGAGRSEIMTALFGCYPGRFEAQTFLNGKKLSIKNPADAVKNGICMVPEDRKRHGIVPLLGVGENITMSVTDRFSRYGLIDKAAEMTIIDDSIKRLRLKTASPTLPISNLSGGNQQKAVLSKMLLPHPQVLILDEPTRGVDVGSKYEIYKLIFELAREGIAIVMVSSEMPEILGISDRVLVIGKGSVRGDFTNEGLTQEKILTAALGESRSAAA